MLKKHKRFDRPRKQFDTVRINRENGIVVKYGLKNKREIWKAQTKLNSIRRRAKLLINESSDIQGEFLDKLNNQGHKVENIVDVLALTVEDILSRRLQTLLIGKKLATTLKGARQLITHKHVKVNGIIVNIPSYVVSVNEEDKIELTSVIKKPKVKASVEEDISESPIENPQENVEEPKKEMEVVV
jgi:small subunit ribosomal protein S4